MDAFFVKCYEFVHPYFLRLWCPSSFEGSSLLLTFDGVKIRLLNYLTKHTIKEVDFLNHLALSYVISIYHPMYPSKAIFLLVKDRRNLWAYDDQLSVIQSLSIDTSLIILAMVWSQSQQILYISGNFGWMRALKLKVTTSISGTLCEWIPIWTKHDSGQWMQHLALDENRKYLFGASGVEVFVWSLVDGQLFLKFDTKHQYAITKLKYSHDHLMLFTTSSDGTIKIWRIFERKPDLIRTIKQSPLGPMHLEIDNHTFITMSYERIIRRYNMINGNIMGSLNLEPSVTLDCKNIDRPLQLGLNFSDSEKGRREWLFESEDTKITMYEVHYAPSELSICCDVVSHLFVDNQSRIFALCRNNILHMLYTDASEGKTFDIDTMSLANDPDQMLNPSLVLHAEYANNFLYFTFENGEMKAFDTINYQLFEFHEPDLESTITSICITHDVLSSRHPYCQNRPDVESLLLSCSSKGGLTIHCPGCYNFVASWKLQNDKVVQMKEIPERKLIALIDPTHLRIYKQVDSLLKEACFIMFDDYEIATIFTMAAKDLIIVGMLSGKASIFDLIEEDGQISLKHRLTIRMHENKITTILACCELKKIDECAEIYDSFNLDGLVCSICVDDSMKIYDCYTGVLQYFSDLPVHQSSHDAAFVYQAKIMLALSIDQNIRLLDWPNFERIYPTPPESSDSSQPPTAPLSDSDDSEYYYSRKDSNLEDENSEFPINVDEKNPDTLSPMRSKLESNHVSSSSSNLSGKDIFRNGSFASLSQNSKKSNYSTSSFGFGFKNMNSHQKKPANIENKSDFLLKDDEPQVFLDEKGQIIDPATIPTVKRQKVDLVFENGYPKLKFEQADDNINETEEEEEEEENNEVEIHQDFYLNDLIKPREIHHIGDKPTAQSSVDETIERNRKVLQSVLMSDPETAEIIQTKRVTKIRRVREDEILENEFFDYLFSPDIKNYPSKKHKKRTATPVRSFKFPTEKPQKIPRIGHRRKTRTAKPRTKHFLIIEFENGQTMKTSEMTMEIMQQIANANIKTDQASPDLTPGWVFQRALADLTMNRQRKIRPLLVREQELVALPILTLTQAGVNIGANFHRYFNAKPYKKFVEDTVGTYVTITHNGSVHKNRFMHWEGVEFNLDNFQKKSNVIRLQTVVEDIPYEEEEEDKEEIVTDGNLLISEILARARRVRRDETEDSFVPFDPINYPKNKDQPQIGGNFNFFEKNDPLNQSFIASSPSVKAITSIIDDNDDNPLFSLIKNTPAMSPDQIHAQLHDDRLNSITMYQKSTGDDVAFPSITNSFTFQGLTGGGGLSNGLGRPASPRPMDALAELTKKMEIGQPLLPVISEDYLIESSTNTSDDDDFDDESESSLSDTRMHGSKLTRTQSIIQESLQRNDFKALRDALSEAGLLCEAGLIDLPRWQPTVNFMTHHQKRGYHKGMQLESSSSSEQLPLNNNNVKNESASTMSTTNDSFQNMIDPENIINKVKKITQKTSQSGKSKNNINSRATESETESDYSEEEEDIDNLISSISQHKKSGQVTQLPLNHPRKSNKASYNTSQGSFASGRSTNSNNSVGNELGSKKDHKKLYKAPKDNLKFKKKAKKIKEIKIKGEVIRQPKMHEIIPGQTIFQSSKIKSLLKDRPDHIDIDFGDGNLYQAGLRKYFVKSLLKEGPKFTRHNPHSKNPLMMAHGSDSDGEAIFDETIKNVKVNIKVSKSFGSMPLPRLSPRNSSDNEQIIRYEEEEEEEEEEFFDSEIEDLLNSSTEYESEYYDSEDDSGKKVKKKRYKKKKPKKKPLKKKGKKRKKAKKANGEYSYSSSEEEDQKLKEPTISWNNPLGNRQPKSETKKHVEKKKEEPVETDDKYIIMGTIKSQVKPQTRNRRNQRTKKPVTNKEEEDNVDYLKEMNDILNKVQEEESQSSEYYYEEEDEEEEEGFLIEENPEQVMDTIIEETSKETKKKPKKKLKKKYSSKSRLLEDEDDAKLLESLVTSTKTSNNIEMNLGELMRAKASKSPEKVRPAALGKHIDYQKNKFQSLKRNRVIRINKNGWEMKVMAKSTNDLLKKKEGIPRRKLFMLKRIDMSRVPQIILSYEAQTLWDQKTGKLRRNSFDETQRDKNAKY
ncbi:hypothetical protein TRFO_06680 [Tritrichomonas foetus]|uniref:Uncharacterized protein n=1 Tax=Tritrichomonas foetus TaxID=1144522 RepID=A0A1J4JY98_9EUKA|nr:hypothetical protein TRFO_06680 [Tritrichomonas foetus]|eukprot:OHT03440.1 hypothetical protein TRFO_06680 [Tritrichomonas foetus]